MQLPPPMPPDPRVLQDAEHLKHLEVAHYVIGGLTALAACIPTLHLAMGVMMISGVFPGPADDAREAEFIGMIGAMIVIFSAVMILLGWALALSMILTAKWLSARRNYTFCLVVSCLECVVVPVGTVLGVFTLLVLQRPSVKGLFDGRAGIGAGTNR